MHVVSPGSAGYFHRAIMQSGYASTRWPTLADAEALGHDFAAAVGCTDPSQVLACMRSKPRAEVLLAFANGQQEFAETARIPWGPVVDGLDIPDQPRRLYEDGTFNRVPLIIGATRDEGWIYVDRSFPAGLTAEQYQTAVATEFGAADAPAILAHVPGGRLPVAKTRAVAVDGRRRNGLRGAPRRAPGRADADARLLLFLRTRSGRGRPRPRHPRPRQELRLRQQLRSPVQLRAQRGRPVALRCHQRLLDALCGYREARTCGWRRSTAT